MPRRDDLKSILILGSGPIVIGQACEFDYSGVQACKALREEGYRVILANSNPATIMTDPEMADRTYIEPLVPEVLERIIAAERPDALLPTVGGQTAINLAVPWNAMVSNSSAQSCVPFRSVKNATSSRRPWGASAWRCPAAPQSIPCRRRKSSLPLPSSPLFCAPPSHWAEPAAESPITSGVPPGGYGRHGHG